MLKQGFTADSSRSQSKVASDSELFFALLLQASLSIFRDCLKFLDTECFLRTFRPAQSKTL